MKAPDKIYIPIIEEDGKRLLCTNWWETDARNAYVNETIPYIRKDALLEFVKKKLQESADRLDFHANQAYAEVFDKLNEI